MQFLTSLTIVPRAAHARGVESRARAGGARADPGRHRELLSTGIGVVGILLLFRIRRRFGRELRRLVIDEDSL